jgi:hypothetical protein
MHVDPLTLEARTTRSKVQGGVKEVKGKIQGTTDAGRMNKKA